MKRYLTIVFFVLGLLNNLNAQTPSLIKDDYKRESIAYMSFLSANIRFYDEFLNAVPQPLALKEWMTPRVALSAAQLKVVDFCKDPFSFDPGTIPPVTDFESTYKTLLYNYANTNSNGLSSKSQIIEKGLSKSDIDSKGLATKALQFGGADWEAAFIEGLTDFLLDRAKDEVVLSFANELKKVIKDPKYKDIADLFPNFQIFLSNSGSTSFEAFIPSLRSAIISDLSNLPFSISQNAAIRSKLIAAGQSTNSLDFIPVMYPLIKDLFNKKDPFVTLSQLSDESFYNKLGGGALSPNQKNTKDGCMIIGILSREYYTVKNSSFPLYNDQSGNLSDFISTAENRIVFVRFLQEELLKKKISFSSTINSINLVEYINKLQEVENAVSDIKNVSNKTDSIYANQYVAYLNSFSSAIETGLTLFPLINSDDKNTFSVFKQLTEINIAVIHKDYNAAIVTFVSLIKDKNILDEKILRLLSFMGSLAEVKNSEDVKATLQSFADPVGSYMAKRSADKVKGTFTINSYLGYSIGKEWLQSDVSDVHNQVGTFIGLTLPLGLEYSISTKSKVISSIGFFGSIIDLGNLASFRVSGNSFDSLHVNTDNQKVSFNQVLSPGTFIVFGITQNYPITLGLGYQYVPGLRTIQNNTLTIDNSVNVSRFTFFLGIDLTIFKFN